MAREAHNFVDEALLIHFVWLLIAELFACLALSIVPLSKILENTCTVNGHNNKMARFARHFCWPFSGAYFSSNLDKWTTGSASQLSFQYHHPIKGGLTRGARGAA